MLLALALAFAPALAQDGPPTDERPPTEAETAAEEAKPLLRGANEAWKPKFYYQPIFNAQGVQGRSGPFIQARGGGDIGWRYHSSLTDKPILLGRTRLRAVGLYGIGTNSWGIDARLGSFLGPQLGKYVTLQHGPDFWFNFYGTSTSTDYFLPPTPGLSFLNQMLIQPIPELGFLFQASPGWVFRESRHPPQNYAYLFHEVDLVAAVVVNTGATGPLTIGYQRTYDGYGMRQGLIFTTNWF